jgi:hypothetical protein
MAQVGYKSFRIMEKNDTTTISVPEEDVAINERLGKALDKLGITYDGLNSNKIWFKSLFNPSYNFPDGEYQID